MSEPENECAGKTHPGRKSAGKNQSEKVLGSLYHVEHNLSVAAIVSRQWGGAALSSRSSFSVATSGSSNKPGLFKGLDHTFADSLRLFSCRFPCSFKYLGEGKLVH